jgi:acyl dehydratase
MESLVCEAMRCDQGVWGDEETAPPVTLTDIRRWAMATWYPETPPRLHWDEAHAAATRWGGVIAPPGFNPFVWPIDRRAPRWMDYGVPAGRQLVGLNGGQVETYGAPIRPGDAISARSRLTEFTEREGRFGLMLYFHIELEWTNQTDAFVRRRLSTMIRYRA